VGKIKNRFWSVFGWFMVFLVPSISFAALPESTEEVLLLKRPSGYFRLGAGIGNPGNKLGVPVMAGVWFHLSEKSSYMGGIDSGVVFSKGHSSVPLLASVALFLNGIPDSALQPYLGGSVGPTLGIGEQADSFAVLFRPGILFNLAYSLKATLEIPFGALNQSFYVGPQANILMHF
jgi:hypothetical protein